MANEFFIAIKQPKTLRKALLTGSKNILEILQMSQELIDLRNEKLFVMDILKQELAELQLLFEKLQENFPEELLDEAPVTPVVPKKKKEKDQKLPELKASREEPMNAMAELERIEGALKDVEDKLKYLD